ncbi:MAG: DUF2848 family protein [Deltaproteobacteria bacterium]
MVNAGYVGRNQDEVRRHINELAEKGIPGPKKVPNRSAPGRDRHSPGETDMPQYNKPQDLAPC